MNLRIICSFFLLSLFLFSCGKTQNDTNNPDTSTGPSIPQAQVLNSLNREDSLVEIAVENRETECKSIVEQGQDSANLLADSWLVKDYINATKYTNEEAQEFASVFKEQDCNTLNSEKNISICTLLKSGDSNLIDSSSVLDDYEKTLIKGIVRGTQTCSGLGYENVGDCSYTLIKAQYAKKWADSGVPFDFISYRKDIDQLFMNTCLAGTIETPGAADISTVNQ